MQKKQKKQKKSKKKQKTKAKAKGTYKKKNFKSQSVFGCKSKCLASCKQIFKLPAASKKNMEQKPIPSILTMIKSKSENIMSFKIAIASNGKNELFKARWSQN
jgi:hypothetical protein